MNGIVSIGGLEGSAISDKILVFGRFRGRVGVTGHEKSA
jgi:hypothetical protein